MIQNQVNPPLDETLEHHGIKGMRWGVRRNQVGTQSQQVRAAKRQQTMRRVGVGVLAVGGAAATAYLLSKNGKVPTTILKPTFSEAHARQMNMVFDAQRVSAAKAGREATRTLSNQVWSKSVNDIMTKIDEANASQDQWMRSMGLGSVVNNKQGI